ncbi:MAG TPA: ABC transporter ATP-binding protein [Aggregatilinea sp.]|uniref:energy-coupling factor ABC transporter ATP-binding protein n=1 Tax=Aggregatilinea sp. TaxID=2806333 RepID=UPI002CF31F38|nr:ABC transporter ATP-binding protein [Aggregatilinea sp.]HML20757.1 ABC transporter ATP-binding protein [Aggregatilinea sp.]
MNGNEIPMNEDCAVAIEHLTFRYPDGRLALDDVSLRVARGERVALVGPNGSGKSTLMLHLNGILGARNGGVQVDGLPVQDAHLGAIRSRVGLVFQNPDDQLFSPRVEQDVAFGPLHMGLPEAEVHARVDRALAAVGMGDYAGRTSVHLSVGEKKRIALATVLSMDADLLVLDEPSAGLDPRARRDLIALLRTFEDCTLLVSSHDMRLVWDLCARVVVLDGGRIVADGPTRDLLADADLMERHGLEVPWPKNSG